MRFLGIAGGILLISGLARIWQHAHAPRSLADYLAFRCGGAATADGSWMTTLLGGHCWGCPVSIAGGAMIFAAMVQWMVSNDAGRTRIRSALGH
ncbi:MAG: hypothetical protein R3C00_01740 [Hyphomonas sp.]|nr:hypothetical protein [Hyphomonas sp.]MCB9971577.1 hypothetical protein [Hyphomonas sp.]